MPTGKAQTTIWLNGEMVTISKTTDCLTIHRSVYAVDFPPSLVTED